jgi:ankyrin repeat protein
MKLSFFEAVKEHYPSSPHLEQYLNSGENPNSRDESGNSALYVALSKKNDWSVNLLIAYGADANLTPSLTDKVNSLLHIAIKKWTGVEKLITAGANVNIERDPDRKRPLHLAATQSEDDINLLLSEGADINAQDINGKTALHIAARGELNTGTFSTLIKRGADYNIRDNDGKTVIDYLTDAQKLKIFLNLSDFCESPEATKTLSKILSKSKDERMHEFLKFFLNPVFERPKRELEEKTLEEMQKLILSEAIDNSDVFVIRSILARGLDVNTEMNKKGFTPLHLAVEKNSKPIIDVLLEAGANVNRWDKKHESPLYLAANTGKLSAFNLYFE